LLLIYLIFLVIRCCLPWLEADRSNVFSFHTTFAKKDYINNVRLSRNYENQKQVCIKKPVIYFPKIKFNKLCMLLNSSFNILSNPPQFPSDRALNYDGHSI